MRKGPRPSNDNHVRNEMGIIVTLRRQDTLELFSMHVAGLRGEALRHLAALIDHSGVDWRVLCYSTPLLIKGDVQQRRAVQQKSETRRTFTYLNTPEASALARIDRLDLLDPAIDRSDDDKRTTKAKRDARRAKAKKK